MEAYYQRYEDEFTAIEHSDTHAGLEDKVRARVTVALGRLKEKAPTAYDLLLRSSVFRLAVVADFWFEMLPGVKEREKKKARNVLESCSWVIEEGNSLRQHNLIRSTASSWLQKEKEKWQEVHREAARLWLQEYEADREAENLVKVRGYLEAFYHFCEIEAWEDARDILTIKMNTPTQQQLQHQLFTWGYYRQRIELCSQLLNKLDDNWQGICLNGLGIAYHNLGSYQQAINYFQQSLTIFRKISDSSGESSTLGNLGNAHYSLGEYHQAINYLQQQLNITREIGDRNGEGNALGNLGCAYNSLGDYNQAINYFQKSLAITKRISNQNAEGHALGNLGKVYYKLEDYSISQKYSQAALDIFSQIGAKHGEAEALKNLALANKELDNLKLAKEQCQQALEIATELGIPLVKECRELQEKLGLMIDS